MYSIPLSTSVSLVFKKLHWSIDFTRKVNTDHHLAKNEDRDFMDHYGDLSRLIPALGKYTVEPSTITTLRKNYIQCLREIKEATNDSKFDFSNKIKWTVVQGDLVHTVKTNKVHRGVYVEFQYDTEHHKSEGCSNDSFTAPTHQKAAEMLLNKTIMNAIPELSFDALINTMNSETSRIVESLTAA